MSLMYQYRFMHIDTHIDLTLAYFKFLVDILTFSDVLSLRLPSFVFEGTAKRRTPSSTHPRRLYTRDVWGGEFLSSRLPVTLPPSQVHPTSVPDTQNGGQGPDSNRSPPNPLSTLHHLPNQRIPTVMFPGVFDLPNFVVFK